MGTKMKGIALVIIGFAVLTVLVISGALNPLASDLYKTLTDTSSSNESPTDTPTPSDKPVTPVRNISIYYTLETTQIIPSQYGDVEANSSSSFLKVSMDIENNGYDAGFSTNPALFNVRSDEVDYSVDVLGTGTLGQWRTSSVADGHSYSGTLVFQVPASESEFTLGYLQPISINRYKIFWIKQ